MLTLGLIAGTIIAAIVTRLLYDYDRSSKRTIVDIECCLDCHRQWSRGDHRVCPRCGSNQVVQSQISVSNE